MKKRAISAAMLAGIIIVLVIAVVAGAYIALYSAQQPSPPPEEQKPIKVAAIYTTPLEEPWNSVLHEALLNAQEELGIEYLYVENVAQSDFERVARDYINEGAEIIFAHSYNFYQDTIRLAQEFPEIAFIQGSGPLDAEWPSNVLLYDYWLQDAAFLAGATAGLLTKSDKIGVVAAIPVTDVNNLVNAFIAGARYVNPDVQPEVVFIQSWFDPEAAKNAAKAMINDGVDFIYAERYGVFEACEEAQAEGKEVYAFGNIVDQNDLSPDVVLASVVWDMRDFVKSVIQDKVEGKFQGKIIYNFPGWSKLVWNEELRDKVVPPDVLSQIQELEQKIRSGELEVKVDLEWNPEKWAKPTIRPIKVAAIYTTPLEEPWNSVLHEALLNAQEELGIEYLYVENVAQSDFERVARDYINEGAEIIFAHSYNFYQDTIRLAQEFPDVCFVQGSGPLDAEWPDNVILYDYWLQDAAFLAGATAGLLTKSDKIGVVAAIPVTDVNNLVNAFIYGAKYVNQDVQPEVVFIQSWFDPEAAKNAAKAMINDGVDFIYAERYGVFEACEEAQAEGKEVYAFGNIVDQNDLSPDVVLASVVWDMRDFVKSIIMDVVSGKCEGRIITNFPGWSKLVWNEELRDKVVPPDVLSQIQELEQKIRSGELEIPVDTEWNPDKWGI